jgi:predicted TIM-barrel fold metal-dependent hydrolase
VDTSVSDWILPESELHAFLESVIDAGFGDRIMFGSDQLVWPQTIGIGIRWSVCAPLLRPEQKEEILFIKAARFLRLTPQEISLHKSGSGVRK